MGFFDIFKKKDDSNITNDMKIYSSNALSVAKSDIEEHGTFLAFGETIDDKKTLARIVYMDPNAETIDPREQATKIQGIIAKRYEENNLVMCYMAFDGISHLKTGDIDSVNVRVSHKASNTHKLFSYPYKLVDGVFSFVDVENPIMSNL